MEASTRWLRQATEARDRLRDRGMTREMFLIEAFDLDPQAATSLVEALIELGAPVDARLRGLAGLTA